MLSTLLTATLVMTFGQQTDTTVVVARGQRLEVNAYGGDIRVSTWDRNTVRIEANGPTARVILPPGMKRTHVVLAVRDSGNPRLTRYSRTDLVVP